MSETIPRRALPCWCWDPWRRSRSARCSSRVLLPAAVIATLLMILNYVLSRNNGTASIPRATWPELLRASGGAVLPLVMPVIMVIGIRFGIATPTEVSAVAVLYGLVLAYAIYRAVDLKTLYSIAVDSCLLAGMVLFIIAAAFSFGWTLTAANLPAKSRRDPAFAWRQPHRLHCRLDRSSDRGSARCSKACPR